MKSNLMQSLFVAMPVVALSMLAAGCGSEVGDDDDVNPTPTPVQYIQIERLARPAVNEGLVLDNAFLNAYNSIPPSADLTPAAAPVLMQAAAVLEAVDGLDGVQNVDTNVIVGAFIPDVMRIDTTLAIAPGTAAYPAAASATKGILLGGRKVEDDVIDITLTVLVGAPVSDNVRYQGYGAAAPGAPGHKMLHGQAAFGGAATFPFLAAPN